MAARRKRKPTGGVPASAEVRALERITPLLAMIATKGQIQKVQVPFLQGAGFDVQEIADIVGITTHHVSVMLHSAKQSKRNRRSGRQREK